MIFTVISSNTITLKTMEDIDFKKYDLLYELQYVQLFIELLSPYIKFTSIKNGAESIMKIYLINDNKKHLLTQKQFIYFIQLDFPRIISNKMDKLNNTLDEMKGKYKKYMKSVNTGKNKNELTEYYSKEYPNECKEVKNKIYKLDKINQLNKQFHGKVERALHFLSLIQEYYV